MLTQKIHDICSRLAKILKNTDFIVSVTSLKSNRFISHHVSAWDPLSLDYGYPGLIVLFSEMDIFFPGQDWRKEIRKLVDLLIPEIKKKEHSNFSLFSGFAGICFAIQLAAEREPALQKLDETLCNILLEKVNEYYLKSIDDFISGKHQPVPFQYDSVTGMVCFISYFLKRKTSPKVDEAIKKMLKHLVTLCSFIQVGSNQVPGWYLSPQDPLFKKTLLPIIADALAKDYPDGYFETGLAHGISGCLVALSKALLAGVEIKGQREAIQRVSCWLQTTCTTIGAFESVWPRRFAFNPKALNYVEVPKNPYIDGWSHGAPGIWHSLSMAAQALGDEKILKQSLQGLDVMAGRVLSANTSSGLPFCYGKAGVLAIVYRAALVSGDARLFAKAKLLAESIVNEYSEQYPFGFKCEAPSERENEELLIDNPGLATGTIGILLSLLYSTSTKQRSWLPIFQLN